MCDRPSESSSDDLKMHCLLFSFSPMLRTNSQQLNLHRHIYLSCKAQRNPALQYNIDCEIYQYLPARRLYHGAPVSQPLRLKDISTPDFSNPDFSTMIFSTPDFSTLDFPTPILGLKNPGLESSWLKSPYFEKSGVEMSS